ncbi:glycosyltransferase family 2 protein [Candidatus Parcubacteria bacterium]|nr:glycosyltransferase family 2 protein [Candidatus Parcubacteria bacterium]
MPPRFSIILITFNSARFLGPVLASIKEQTGKNWETIIIDQASNDGGLEIVRQWGHEDERIRIIENPTNIGFCAAVNQGIVASRGETVLLLNHDAVLDARYLELALAVFARDSQIAAVQGKVHRYDFSADEDERALNIIDTTGLIMLKSRRIIDRGQGETDHGQYNAPGEVFGVNGAVSFWRREALEDIRLCLQDRCEYLDEDFFMYKDDVDLSWRARLAGWKIVYDPACLAWHQRGSGRSAARNPLEIVRERSAINALAKYHSWKNARLLVVKNDLALNALADLPWWLAKEVASWLYVLFAEPTTLRALGETLRLLPRALLKRRLIMAKRRVSSRDMHQWFQ